MEAIVPPPSSALLLRETRALDGSRTLLRHGPIRVLCFHGHEAPSLLWELGRLRELTFRAVGEGTGEEIDLDAFDGWYDHLVAWDEEREQVIGAYRLGEADRVAHERGVGGLYTNTLWDYDEHLLASLGGSLELGRSFIRPEYWKSPVALALLWRGIGAWLRRRPQVRTLLGPVSIDRRYRDESVQLMAGHLVGARGDLRRAALVRPRVPFALDPVLAGRGAALPDAHALDAAVAELEPDGRGVPVLVRQYLKLGARVLSLNVDPDFSDVVDALITVDLAEIPPRMRERFLGA